MKEFCQNRPVKLIYTQASIPELSNLGQAMNSASPSAANFTGQGYLLLYSDGSIRAFGNTPNFSLPNTSTAVAIAVHPNGQGLAGISKNGTLLYSTGTASLTAQLGKGGSFVDLLYNSDGSGLWGLDSDCGVWHAGNAASIGYGDNNSNCIRLAMYSDTTGVVLDKNGHLYPVNTDHNGGEQIHFDDGAIGGGYFPAFQGIARNSTNIKDISARFVIATDKTTIKQVSSISTDDLGRCWANLDDGYYPNSTGQVNIQSVLSSAKFNIIDIAATPSGNGYWLLVNFRSALNVGAQFTVIAVGDARAAGGTQLGSVHPYIMGNNPLEPVRIIAMPMHANWRDLYLDTITLPNLYQNQSSGFDAYGQAMGFYDMGYQYALYTPEWAVQSPGSSASGLDLILPLQYISLLSFDCYITIKLRLAYDPTSDAPWSVNQGSYQAYQGSSAITAQEVSKLLGKVKDLTEAIEDALVDAELMSEGTLTPVVCAIETLIIAVDIYEWGNKIFTALSDAGEVNFPSVAAHAVVRTLACLRPLTGVALDSIPDLSGSSGVLSFIDSLGFLVQANPEVYATSINHDPNCNAWQYSLQVDNSGNLGVDGKNVTFRVLQPEQSMAHNNGGCIVSTLITINETLQLDAQCALLMQFAQVAAVNPQGQAVQLLTLVGISGAVAWTSVVNDAVITAIKPCLLGNTNPIDSVQTLNSTQDLLDALIMQISNGAQQQNNCALNIGIGLANFASQVVIATQNSLAAV